VERIGGGVEKSGEEKRREEKSRNGEQEWFDGKKLIFKETEQTDRWVAGLD
jgi:hypothetical protein